MKDLKSTFAILLPVLTVVLSSCTAIAGIFKAGMGFGIFIVLAILGVIVYIAMRAGKTKN